MVNTLHGLDEQTDVAVLRQMVARYSEYQQVLAGQLNTYTQAGKVRDAVLDHMHVSVELLSRAVGQLYHLGAVVEAV